MVKMTTPARISLLLTTALLWSCEQRNEPTPALEVQTTTDEVTAPTVISIPYTPTPPIQVDQSYVFDWETAQYVPNPPAVAPIPVPWSNEAKRAFSDDIRSDYKKADGWEMLYSSFSSKEIRSHSWLLMYNKYRGLLRYYLYIKNGTQFIGGNNVLTHRVDTQGSPSPLLNFSEQSVVDVTKNARFYSSIEPQPISDNIWYALDCEVAYDKQLPTKTSSELALMWSITSDQIKSVRINQGQNLSSLPISIHLEGVDLESAAGQSQLINGKAQLLINGSRGLESLRQTGQDVTAIDQIFTTTTKSSLLTGVITPRNSQSSSLIRWGSEVEITRSTGRSAGLISPVFALPGYDNSRTLGLTPQYNKAPGVFYLDAPPVIKTSKSSPGKYVYALDIPSVRYLFNPAVTNIADIKNLKQEIVASPGPASNQQFVGTTVTANEALSIVGVRVSFDVVPKNGGTPVRIVKTFKATMQES